jgi:hypothetical protein|tara:strand:- start:85 stop:585 length:501 start_codon:yes stop_codon:yes gene_type:complete
MPWKTDLVLMLRSLIGDLDNAKFTDERLKQILVFGAYNVINDADFSQTYSVDVGEVTISPDPISQGDTDFTTLTVYKSACILLGSEVKTEAANAISIKDGPSAIDLRGVTQNLNIMYQDFCSKYDDLLKTYQYNNTLVGQAVLGPYSPGSMVLGANQFDYRGNSFN